MLILTGSLSNGWASMIFQFKQQYGMNIHDAKLPAQSYFESFEERSHNGVIEAETLAHVVSLEEERVQIASKPELPTQVEMRLDSTLTLQTKKRYISRMPTDAESLRTEYRVMTNLRLLAQLRQPGRQLYADLTKDTFNDFLMKRQIERETWGAPVWTNSMEYEFQLMRDAMKLCREQGYSIQAALRATYRNQEHRMKHWVYASVNRQRPERGHFGQSFQRDRATEEAGGSVAKGPISVSTRSQRLWKKFSMLSRSARFRSKGNLVQDRIAGSIMTAPVVTKLMFLVTIVCALLTSEWMPGGTRRFRTS